MSYQDLVRAGAAQGASSSRGGQGPSKSVDSLVFKLANNVSQLKKLVDLLGSSKDTVDHRHRISETNAAIQDLAKQIKEQLTSQHDARGELPPEQQAKNKKLLQDFATILQDYKNAQKIAQEREAASLPRPNPAAGTKKGQQLPAGSSPTNGHELEVVIEKQALLQQQQQREAASLDNAMQYNEALIEEREHGIREIARQIGEVNEMFQDLAVLINDQGVQIVTIDEQITNTAVRTKDGAQELVRADRSQKAYRNKCLCLWLVAAIVVSIIIILLFS